MSEFYIPASPEHIKREKAKARELRQSQWWRQQVGPGICYHCETKVKPQELTMDHLIPIGRGGKTSKKNCVPSCKDCNSKKGSRTKFEMLLQKMSEE